MDQEDSIGRELTREIEWARQQCADAPGDLSRSLICEQLAETITRIVKPLGGSAKYDHPGTVELIYPDSAGTRYSIWQ